MQSIEEFAEDLSREAHGRGLTGKMVNLIRARDKEIIEACKEAIKGEANYVLHRPDRERMCESLDKLLLDLG